MPYEFEDGSEMSVFKCPNCRDSYIILDKEKKGSCTWCGKEVGVGEHKKVQERDNSNS